MTKNKEITYSLRRFFTSSGEKIAKENLHKLNRNFSPSYTKFILEELIKPINETWFRSEMVGWGEYPHRQKSDKPYLLVTNHSGMAFPWDAITFSYKLYERFGFAQGVARALIAPALTDNLFMNPFLIASLWKRFGGVPATFTNFETMMNQAEHNVLVYPEGVEGIGKGFNRRYQLQEMRNTFVRMSLKYKCEIITFSTVNAEYINPFAYSWPWLNKQARILGIPFVPVGITTLLVFFQPWMFYIALPAKLYFVFGRKIRPWEMIDKPLKEITNSDLRNITTYIRKQMQEDLNEARRKYGKNPYRFGSLFREAIKNRRKLHYFMLMNWPFLFSEYDRRYYSGNTKSIHDINIFTILKLIINKPIILAFFIPIFGWPIIFLRSSWVAKQKSK